MESRAIGINNRYTRCNIVKLIDYSYHHRRPSFVEIVIGVKTADVSTTFILRKSDFLEKKNHSVIDQNQFFVFFYHLGRLHDGSESTFGNAWQGEKKRITRRNEFWVLFWNGSPAVVVYCIFWMESEVMTVRDAQDGRPGQVCVSAGAHTVV